MPHSNQLQPRHDCSQISRPKPPKHPLFVNFITCETLGMGEVARVAGILEYLDRNNPPISEAARSVAKTNLENHLRGLGVAPKDEIQRFSLDPFFWLYCAFTYLWKYCVRQTPRIPEMRRLLLLASGRGMRVNFGLQLQILSLLHSFEDVMVDQQSISSPFRKAGRNAGLFFAACEFPSGAQLLKFLILFVRTILTPFICIIGLIWHVSFRGVFFK